MKISTETKVHKGEEVPWEANLNHVRLEHQEIVNNEDAGKIGVHVSSILRERIGVGGSVLPHYHDVSEIIHITAGKVRLFCNGRWESYKSGDTFLVPAGTVHSVSNDDAEPTEQISIFLPRDENVVKNQQFNTFMVDIS